MSETQVVVGSCGSEAVVAGLMETLASKQQAVREARANLALSAWEDRTAARNPQYVRGSVRKDSHISAGGHGHGEVCDITCVTCGVVRTVNKQDAFQVRYCLEHKGEGKKANKVAKSADPSKVQAKIAALEAKLAALQAQEDAAIGNLEVDVTPEQIEALKAQMAA